MIDQYLFFAKVKERAILPTKRVEDSGYDIYPCFEEENILLNPGDIKLIPTGIYTAFSNDLVLFIKERSSTGSIGLSTRMGVIDSGYRGEIIIGLNNTTCIPITIDKSANKIIKQVDSIVYPYSKAIAQGVFCVIPTLEAKEISYDKLMSISSTRNDSIFGASGK